MAKYLEENRVLFASSVIGNNDFLPDRQFEATAKGILPRSNQSNSRKLSTWQSVVRSHSQVSCTRFSRWPELSFDVGNILKVDLRSRNFLKNILTCFRIILKYVEWSTIDYARYRQSLTKCDR